MGMPVARFRKRLSNSISKWNTFLNSLYCKFSEYKMQVIKNNYNAADLEKWGYPATETKDVWKNDSYANHSENQGLKIDRNNYERFLEKIRMHNIAEYDNVKNITITDLQLDELNQILNLTIKEGISICCKEPYMFIKGNYIITSEIYRHIWAGTVDDSCKDILFCNKLKFINIFSLNTFFIDDDIPNIETLQTVSIIAPKWCIIGSRKIELNGKEGEIETKERTKCQPDINGKNGKPGKPGLPGKNFFGIGQEFENGLNLTISVNGGNGGPGQDGENGQNGNDGITPRMPPEIPLRDNLCDNKMQINSFDCELITCKYAKEHFFSGRSPRNCRYKIFGKNGTQGGNGGDGGKGGRGGNPGSITLFELENYSGISQVRKFGQDGIDGRRGVAGHGGRRGNDIIIKGVPKYWSSKWSLINIIHSNERARPGRNGLHGNNSKNIEIPATSPCLNKLNKATIINQYKSFLREKANYGIKQFFAMKFLDLIEYNNNVKSVYDLLGLFDELKSLDEHFDVLSPDKKLLPFYDSLLKRINEYGNNIIEYAHPVLLKKVVTYLHATTYGRKYNLEENFESKLISDTPIYLESVKNDIEKLKDL